MQFWRRTGYWAESIQLSPSSYWDAFAFLQLGRVDDAIRELESLYAFRHPTLLWTNFPEWEPLRSDRRFQALRQRAGLTDEMSAALKALRARPVN
jgi:hypothetical protein